MIFFKKKCLYTLQPYVMLVLGEKLKMDKKTFLEMYKDDIIAEPSGRTYSELQSDKINKFMLVNKMMESDEE